MAAKRYLGRFRQTEMLAPTTCPHCKGMGSFCQAKTSCGGDLPGIEGKSQPPA